jgi:hypothetical protein
VSNHQLNGRWVGILSDDAVTDRLFCADVKDDRCRILDFAGVTGDGQYKGTFGRGDRSGPASITVNGKKVLVSTRRVTLELEIKPSGMLEGLFANAEGRQSQITLRKLY